VARPGSKRSATVGHAPQRVVGSLKMHSAYGMGSLSKQSGGDTGTVIVHSALFAILYIKTAEGA
jgi:hypothetical protein